MKRSYIHHMLLLIFLVFYFPSLLAEEPSLIYTTLCTDAAGESHFGEGSIDYTLEDYAPPAQPMGVHHLKNAQGATFLYILTGTFEDWHPVPRRQFIFSLRGTVEVGVTDGEVRRFGPGTAVLLEDLTGKGHTTKVVSDEDHFSIAVPVPTQ